MLVEIAGKIIEHTNSQNEVKCYKQISIVRYKRIKMKIIFLVKHFAEFEILFMTRRKEQKIETKNVLQLSY